MVKTEPTWVNDTLVTLYYFNVPMMHEDWHEAEELGLKYVGFDSSGNDYWDYCMYFVEEEKQEEVSDWWLKNCW